MYNSIGTIFKGKSTLLDNHVHMQTVVNAYFTQYILRWIQKVGPIYATEWKQTPQA